MRERPGTESAQSVSALNSRSQFRATAADLNFDQVSRYHHVKKQLSAFLAANLALTRQIEEVCKLDVHEFRSAFARVVYNGLLHCNFIVPEAQPAQFRLNQFVLDRLLQFVREYQEAHCEDWSAAYRALHVRRFQRLLAHYVPRNLSLELGGTQNQLRLLSAIAGAFLGLEEPALRAYEAQRRQLFSTIQNTVFACLREEGAQLQSQFVRLLRREVRVSDLEFLMLKYITKRVLDAKTDLAADAKHLVLSRLEQTRADLVEQPPRPDRTAQLQRAIRSHQSLLHYFWDASDAHLALVLARVSEFLQGRIAHFGFENYLQEQLKIALDARFLALLEQFLAENCADAGPAAHAAHARRDIELRFLCVRRHLTLDNFLNE